MFKCKITKKKIPQILNFGKMPIANGFLKKKDFKKEFFYYGRNNSYEINS